MEETTISCRYTFTQAEFERAMRVFWFQTPRGQLSVLIFVIIVGTLLVTNVSDILSTLVGPHRTRIVPILLNLFPLLLFAVFIVGLIKFQTSWAFKRGIFFNQPFSYILNETECQMKTPSVEMKLQWPALTKWKGGTTGFIVYLKGGRSFHWFPYSGFQSPEEIERMRNLLTKKARKAVEMGNSKVC
jgi:hypothetical protein